MDVPLTQPGAPPHMSYATTRDLLQQLYDDDCDTITASTSVRYTLDAETARRFQLRRSNATSLRLAGTKQRPARSK